MEKRYRFIAKNVVFLICVYVDTINCTPLKLTDPNICPRRVIIRNYSVTKKQLILECCPDYVNQNGKCQACPAGKYGRDCSLPCMPNYHGVQCKKLCNCADYKKCDPVYGCVCDTGYTGSECSNECPSGRYGVNCSEECFCEHEAKCNTVTGDCLCSAGWLGDHCTSECHLGYYDYNNNYNCSKTCVCIDGALCNTKSGICECKDNTSCINIRKKLIPNSISSNYMNRNLFVVVVTITVSFICVLLLVLTYLLLWRYLKHRHNRSSHDDVVETRSVQGHFNESNYYSDILDDQLQDIRGTSSGMIENDNLQYRFQRTTNREHGYQNIAQSLSNIHLFEEEYYNSYCSLQHENEDYLNPYCALRFERRVHSSFF